MINYTTQTINPGYAESARQASCKIQHVIKISLLQVNQQNSHNIGKHHKCAIQQIQTKDVKTGPMGDRRHQRSKFGHKNLITGYTFLKLVTGYRTGNRLTGSRLTVFSYEI